MLRKTSQLLAENGIVRELAIKLKRDIRAESLCFLNCNKTNKTPLQRRASVAGTSLFNVNNTIQETGFDHLEKIQRPVCSEKLNDDEIADLPNDDEADDMGLDRLDLASLSVEPNVIAMADDSNDNFDLVAWLNEPSNANDPDFDNFDLQDFCSLLDKSNEAHEAIESIEPTIEIANTDCHSGERPGYDEKDNLDLVSVRIEPNGSTIEMTNESGDNNVDDFASNSLFTLFTEPAAPAGPTPANRKKSTEVARVDNIQAVDGIQLFNDYNPFDPFNRKKSSLPFTLNGRPRAISVDAANANIHRHASLPFQI